MAWEFTLLDWMQRLHTPLWDAVMAGVSRLGNHGLIWIILALALLAFPKTRRAGAVVAAALLLDWGICSGILKPLVNRARPCDINTAVQLVLARPHDASFPSGHAAAAFAAVSALWQCRSHLFWPATVLALGIAVSRLYLYLHFPTDVLAGILFGWLFGWLGAKLVSRAERFLRKKQKEREQEMNTKC